MYTRTLAHTHTHGHSRAQAGVLATNGYLVRTLPSARPRARGDPPFAAALLTACPTFSPLSRAPLTLSAVHPPALAPAHPAVPHSRSARPPVCPPVHPAGTHLSPHPATHRGPASASVLASRALHSFFLLHPSLALCRRPAPDAHQQRLDCAVMHVSCIQSGMLLARLGRPEVANCATGLEQYAYAYEECADSAAEIRRSYAAALAGECEWGHMASVVPRVGSSGDPAVGAAAGAGASAGGGGAGSNAMNVDPPMFPSFS